MHERIDRETEASLHLFRVFSKAFKSVSDHSAAGCKHEGFNPTDFAVLEMLYHKGPQPIQQIGSKLLLQSGNVTYVIDKLERNGYLERHPSAKDRRVIFAELTADGRDMMERIFPRQAVMLRRALSGLTLDEKQQAISLLKKLGLQAERLGCTNNKPGS
ncbi:MarR family transcriptional regulator [Paenibacillus sp. ACRRX]|uniref:MarR family winged helix-turn-helix transcriptional regulator n=1 Tax=unclassified Paenibacillus TaxID=185978 RepID=UPI001EF47A5A|nr:MULTISPECIES: MarR family transcriptional regulator [unclassified Paenibacillus]MCG7408560.1 MarR family transcriptional regulator [Paenibacillus sp. ACRRX]MDK8182808.1 MarR family transcriptional regulator [Paenibacillus sp. UMB4589-SE434]